MPLTGSSRRWCRRRRLIAPTAGRSGLSGLRVASVSVVRQVFELDVVSACRRLAAVVRRALAEPVLRVSAVGWHVPQQRERSPRSLASSAPRPNSSCSTKRHAFPSSFSIYSIFARSACSIKTFSPDSVFFGLSFLSSYFDASHFFAFPFL